jgi:hypothetical protein
MTATTKLNLLTGLATFVDVDDVDVMAGIFKSQDEAAARLRKVQGLDRHTPPERVPEGRS